MSMNARSSAPGSRSTRPHSATRCCAQDRFELAGMPEGELAQQGSDRRRRVHTVEQGLHPTAAHDVDIVDAVRARAHAGDQRGQFRGRVGRPGLDPGLGDVASCRPAAAAARSARPASSPGPARHTTRDCRRRTPPTQRTNLCDTCTGSAFPNWVRLLRENTNHPSSEGTFLISTPPTRASSSVDRGLDFRRVLGDALCAERGLARRLSHVA